MQTLFGPPEEKKGLFDRLQKAVQSTKQSFMGRVEEALRGKKEFDGALWTELEEALIAGDVGMATTEEVIQRVRRQVERGQVADAPGVKAALKGELLALLETTSNGLPKA